MKRLEMGIIMNSIRNIIKKFINKYRFHITKENPLGKKDAILEAEAICPTCACKSVYYNVKNIENGKKYRRFKYRCPECGTEWLGNCFRPDDYSLVDVWKVRSDILFRRIIQLLICLIFFSLVVRACI